MRDSPQRPVELCTTYRNPAHLHPNPRNPRTHSPAQLHQICASIRQFDFLTPVLVDASAMIVAGHGRVVAAQRLGLVSIPTVRVDHLSPPELRAFAIADNKI